MYSLQLDACSLSSHSHFILMTTRMVNIGFSNCCLLRRTTSHPPPQPHPQPRLRRRRRQRNPSPIAGRLGPLASVDAPVLEMARPAHHLHNQCPIRTRASSSSRSISSSSSSSSNITTSTSTSTSVLSQTRLPRFHNPLACLPLVPTSDKSLSGSRPINCRRRGMSPDTSEATAWQTS
jgi:hypothetical protein